MESPNFSECEKLELATRNEDNSASIFLPKKSSIDSIEESLSSRDRIFLVEARHIPTISDGEMKPVSKSPSNSALPIELCSEISDSIID